MVTVVEVAVVSVVVVCVVTVVVVAVVTVELVAVVTVVEVAVVCLIRHNDDVVRSFHGAKYTNIRVGTHIRCVNILFCGIPERWATPPHPWPCHLSACCCGQIRRCAAVVFIFAFLCAVECC